jgi:hypothetical protein
MVKQYDRKYSKEYYQKHKEGIAKRQKEYINRNKEKVLEYQAKWREDNKDKRRINGREYYNNNQVDISIRRSERHQKNKMECIKHYSGGTMKCAKCEVDNINMLVLDHINDDGHKDRRCVNSLYYYLIREGFPPGFQVLCANHNQEKEILRSKVKTIGGDIIHG